MPVLAVSDLRQLVAARIDAAMGAEWRESKGTWDTFGEADGEGRFHKGFAVGCPDTKYKAGRQRPSEGALSETSVQIRWAYHLGAMKQVEDFDAALDEERRITAAVAGIAQSPGVSLAFVSASRRVEGEWVLGEQEWTALHWLPLT